RVRPRALTAPVAAWGVAVAVWLLVPHHGVAGPATRAQPFTRFGSTCAAAPAVSATRCLEVYPPDVALCPDIPPDPPNPPPPPYCAVAALTTPSTTRMPNTKSTLFNIGTPLSRASGTSPWPAHVELVRLVQCISRTLANPIFSTQIGSRCCPPRGTCPHLGDGRLLRGRRHRSRR